MPMWDVVDRKLVQNTHFLPPWYEFIPTPPYPPQIRAPTPPSCLARWAPLLLARSRMLPHAFSLMQPFFASLSVTINGENMSISNFDSSFPQGILQNVSDSNINKFISGDYQPSASMSLIEHCSRNTMQPALKSLRGRAFAEIGRCNARPHTSLNLLPSASGCRMRGRR